MTKTIIHGLRSHSWYYAGLSARLESNTLDKLLIYLDEKQFTDAVELYRTATGESAANAIRTVKRLQMKQIAERFSL